MTKPPSYLPAAYPARINSNVHRCHELLHCILLILVATLLIGDFGQLPLAFARFRSVQLTATISFSRELSSSTFISDNSLSCLATTFESAVLVRTTPSHLSLTKLGTFRFGLLNEFPLEIMRSVDLVEHLEHFRLGIIQLSRPSFHARVLTLLVSCDLLHASH